MLNYRTDVMLIDKSYPLCPELLTHDNWKMVYDDRVSAVFIPSAKSNGKRGLLPNEDYIFKLNF